MNLMDIVAALTGYSLLGLAGLAVSLVCLVGLLLVAIVAIGHLARRRQGDDDPGPETPGRMRKGSALESFRWEDSTE
ncbi:hypothetical protein [Streptomyces sp. NPDC047079]|uniref:hypothetical protein n=1 Tax=Streptomyces sp. NPDC047079 TaxID=3154607 RepID=UPI0033C6CF6D